VQSFNWSYVSLVTSEGQYGDSGMNAFAREAKKRNICIAMNEKVPQNADNNYFNQILTNLKAKPNARGVVLFLRAEDNRGLLEAAKAANQTNYFTFIASDGWGKQEKLVEGVEEEAEGAITVELQSKEIEEFDYYIGNLSAYHNRNPWFEEYWQDTFSCKLHQFVTNDDNNTIPICSPNLRIDKSMGYKQESKVQFVVDAVYAFAHALHNAWLDLCSDMGLENYCPALKELDGESFYKKYLLNVSFTGNMIYDNMILIFTFQTIQNSNSN
jgi:metabotropic glutamate receptor 2/3